MSSLTLTLNSLSNRWFEADNDDELFSMFAFPISLEDYFKGVDHMEYLMMVEYSEDYMIPVVVDRSAADDPEKTPFLCMAGDLCFPRSVTFEVSRESPSPHMNLHVYTHSYHSITIINEHTYNSLSENTGTILSSR